MFEKFNRLEVLVVPVFICDPLSVLSAVVQIQHGGDGIHPQTVYMELLHPVKRIRKQEILHLRTAVVKDLGAPVRMLSLSRVRMLVYGIAVKICESLGIFRKMSGNPVQNDTDLVAMKIIHQILEICRRPVAGSRRIISCHLVSPGLIERMLGYAHKLDVSVSHVLHILDDPLREFPVSIEPFRVFLTVWMLHPGPGMHLVDRQRSRFRHKVLPVADPRRVTPPIAQIRYSRSRSRTKLRPVPVRIRLVQLLIVLRDDQIFVELTHCRSRDKDLPDSLIFDLLHGIRILIPAVKLSDHIHRDRIRRP